MGEVGDFAIRDEGISTYVFILFISPECQMPLSGSASNRINQVY